MHRTNRERDCGSFGGFLQDTIHFMLPILSKPAMATDRDPSQARPALKALYNVYLVDHRLHVLQRPHLPKKRTALFYISLFRLILTRSQILFNCPRGNDSLPFSPPRLAPLIRQQNPVHIHALDIQIRIASNRSHLSSFNLASRQNPLSNAMQPGNILPLYDNLRLNSIDSMLAMLRYRSRGHIHEMYPKTHRHTLAPLPPRS